MLFFCLLLNFDGHKMVKTKDSVSNAAKGLLYNNFRFSHWMENPEILIQPPCRK
jgi:hypothetical protein